MQLFLFLKFLTDRKFQIVKNRSSKMVSANSVEMPKIAKQ